MLVVVRQLGLLAFVLVVDLVAHLADQTLYALLVGSQPLACCIAVHESKASERPATCLPPELQCEHLGHLVEPGREQLESRGRIIDREHSKYIERTERRPPRHFPAGAYRILGKRQVSGDGRAELDRD